MLGVLLLQYFSTSYSEVETIPYSQFEQLLNADRIAEVTVKTDSIEGRLVDPLPSGATRPSPNRSQCEVLGLACGLAMIIGHNIWSGGANTQPCCQSMRTKSLALSYHSSEKPCPVTANTWKSGP